MKSLKKLTTLAAVLAALAVNHAFAVEVGQPAPDFSLKSIEGKSHSLSEFRGKTVVLEWHNPDCPFVVKHYASGNIPKLQKAAADEGVVWLTINSGAPGLQGADYSDQALKDYFAKHGASPAAYFRDQDGKVGHLYSAKTTPHIYVIDGKGTLVYQGGIDSIPSAKADDIAKATNYTREALDAVKTGKPVPNATTKPYGCSVKYGKS